LDPIENAAVAFTKHSPIECDPDATECKTGAQPLANDAPRRSRKPLGQVRVTSYLSGLNTKEIEMIRWAPALFMFLTLLLTTAPSQAQTVFVRPLTGTGIAADELQSVNELVVMGVRAAGAQTVAQENKAEATIEGKLVKLGTAYVLSLSKVRSGQVVFTEQARAQSIEDMDTVANRLTRAVVRETKFAGEARVTEVTDDEVQRSVKRRQATKQWMFSVGPALNFSNLNASESGVAWGLGFFWGVDPKFDLSLVWRWATSRDKDDEARFSDFSIGLTYLFTEASFSPYVFGEFGYGGAAPHRPLTQSNVGDDASGFVGALGAGVKFFRTSTVNLSLSLRYAQVFDSIQEGQPGLTSMNLGLHF